ncbi:HTH-type transcriptional regulator ImmR [compost metagenome]|mgnify:FL=1|jgi:transcriptional regulator with XRE-family HTH domain|uniref:Helix-turn-helix domain-containing protein n=3 Tax=Paenibacillus TaxID=44249 RepID=A0A9X2BTI4_9BACL|nr:MULTISPECIES: helix-turn-helix transcriptional regulator [Paenibacillus]DAI82631.1 MAG TPA: helix-turn-helix domain protein [Caudoviricetes sp.]MBM6995069.1 helix-turn-helix transcriptional regulator [Paenibacillus rhizolycopersici]MCH1641748.1 helix-turn-helix domain-containing protein [Paenibacillus timonensis]MCK8487986.1 helix-turn-helix domain-containing protein [Paenibacillus mellifer]MDU2243443.1 helix-turn-helix transcriptional regulator [Paenibacillus sp.]
MQTLGDRIKYLREQRQLTQKDLASQADISVVQLSRYETNDRKPDPEVLRNIVDALDTSADYLLGRTPDPSPAAEKGMSLSFFGGPEAYTADEIAMMEAALKAYREQKKKLLNGDEAK